MALTLGELVTQISSPIGRTDFLGAGGAGTTGAGGATGAGGVTINVPAGSTGSTAPASSSSSTGIFNSLVNWLVQPGSATGSFLLRLLLFILGLIAIAGAIYLYKGSNPILAVPGKLAKGAVKAGSAALKAAGQGEE